MSNIGFNKVELDTLFRIYIQAAEFAKSRLFLNLFTTPSKTFSTYHGRRKLPKAGWASSNVRSTIFPPLVQIELTDLPKPGWAIKNLKI